MPRDLRGRPAAKKKEFFANVKILFEVIFESRNASTFIASVQDFEPHYYHPVSELIFLAKTLTYLLESTIMPSDT